MSSPKLLLVDDQAFIRHIYSTDLKNHGFDVHCEENGNNAIEYILNNTVDLILLDAVMPGLNGFDTCIKIKSNPKTQKIPVIFLTANADKRSVIKAVQAGANDFFVKSPETDSLMEKIHKLIPEF